MAKNKNKNKKPVPAPIRNPELKEALAVYDGHDTVAVYLKAEKQYKKLPPSMSVSASPEAILDAGRILGPENVRFAALKAR